MAPQIGTIMGAWKSAGIIARENIADFRVDELRWAMAPHEVKVSIAIAGFCKAHPDGLGQFTVYASRSNAVMSTVVNGDYTD